MINSITIRPGQWAGLGHLPRIIVIIVVIAAVTRWAPDATLPLIAGLALGSWLAARTPLPGPAGT